MKRFAKIIILLCFCLFQQALLHAQPGRDKVEALRVSFISKKLELSTSEYEKFWPAYNEYNDKIKAIRKNLRQSYRKAAGSELSDAEAEELYQLDLRSKQAEVDVHKQYSQKIKDIIGVKKMAKLRIAEEQFKREMINTLQQDKSD
jgi:hypothetical protein